MPVIICQSTQRKISEDWKQKVLVLKTEVLFIQNILEFDWNDQVYDLNTESYELRKNMQQKAACGCKEFRTFQRDILHNI
jgi:hypothetical protein